jgi:hypothetical protein
MASSFDSVEGGSEMITKVFDPGPSGAGIVLGRLDQFHETADGAFKAPLEFGVGELTVLSEGVVRLGEGEHVRIDPCPQVFKGDPQRPQPSAASGH